MSVVTHINRKGVKYFLHEGRTKTGKIRYFMAKAIRDGSRDSVPTGYEICEDVNGLVSVSKCRAELIPPADLKIIEDSLRNYPHLATHKVRARYDRITIYAPLGTELGMLGDTGEFGTPWDELQEPIYEAVMRFILRAKEKMYFVERKHYHGEGGWLPLDIGDDLPLLSKRYLKHISKESFYNLM